MKIMLSNFSNFKQNYTSTSNSSQRKKKSNSLNFSGSNKRAATNNTKLVIVAALLSIASHVSGQSSKIDTLSKAKIPHKTELWWNKFSPKEQKIVQKVEDEVLRIYQEDSTKSTLKDSTKIFNNLNISQKHKPLVTNLLKQYESDTANKSYIATSDSLSPHKKKLRDKSSKAVADYTLNTGKLLKYNDQNVEAIAKNVGAKKSEIPFLKVFLKPKIQLSEPPKDAESFYNKVLLGDISELNKK